MKRPIPHLNGRRNNGSVRDGNAAKAATPSSKRTQELEAELRKLQEEEIIELRVRADITNLTSSVWSGGCRGRSLMPAWPTKLCP